jgi:hypothetical protein
MSTTLRRTRPCSCAHSHARAEFCSIVVDREHETLFVEEIATRAEKRYLKAAVEKWHHERDFAYMMVMEDHTNETAITFVSKQAFAEKLAETFTNLAGANCLWVLLIDKESHHVFQQVLDADNETETGHRLN